MPGTFSNLQSFEWRPVFSVFSEKLLVAFPLLLPCFGSLLHSFSFLLLTFSMLFLAFLRYCISLRLLAFSAFWWLVLAFLCLSWLSLAFP